MNFFEILSIALAVSMDAFAVSICKGLSVKKIKPSYLIKTGLFFGGFQALMPTIGYLFGNVFYDYITKFDHWIAFILLGIIGINMIKEAKNDDKDNSNSSSFATKDMLTLAIATSIDALVVGFTFAVSDTNMILSITSIGIITGVLSALGVFLGNKFGDKFQSKSEIFGGIILISIGTKILITDLIEMFMKK